MSRRRKLPADDALLTATEAARLLGIHRDNWARYWQRFPGLAKGMRTVRVDEKSPGRRRWLRSALVEHMHLELLFEEQELAEASR